MIPQHFCRRRRRRRCPLVADFKSGRRRRLDDDLEVQQMMLAQPEQVQQAVMEVLRDPSTISKYEAYEEVRRGVPNSEQ
eukprot:SAG31_NODE_1213_length_9359_cov_4.298164_2_plen_79_part_00